MNPILVIADDFTGAAEIGGIAADYGLRARIGFGHFPATEADVIVIDTDTRHLPDIEASNKIQTILGDRDFAQFGFVYKKTDSVLRGPVAAELTAIMSCVGLQQCLLLPQNPSRDRTIENGQYFVDGRPLHQTSFAADPEHPAKTADVLQLLNPNERYSVHGLRTGDAFPRPGIAIGDAKSSADMNYWASRLTAKMLVAGGADFFTSILKAQGKRREPCTPLIIDSANRLFICGSASAESRSFINQLPNCCTMPAAVFDPATVDNATIELWNDLICEEFRLKGGAVIAVRHPPIPERSKHVRQMLAEITARVMQRAQPRALFVEGGATAAAVIQRLGWIDLEIAGQLCPGVVALRPLVAPDQLLIVKPGSYRWPIGIFPQ